MKLKFSLLNRNRHWLFICLALFFLILVYFICLAYFNKSFLVATEQKAISGETASIKTNSLKTNSAIYNFFFNLSKAISSSTSSENLIIKDQILYLGAFPYTAAVVDLSKSNLNFDNITNAITFLPDYNWSPADQETITANQDKFNEGLNPFKGPYNDKRCLKNDCLEQRGNSLFFNDKPLELPAGINKNNLQAISIGTVSDNWLVGFTVKDKEFKAEVFYFNGLEFSKMAGFEDISSSYFGLLGFGGETDDFLIIYGAYQGQAFRIRNGKIDNLDRFFSYRPMQGGFKPEIIRAGNASYVNWYVYSSSLNSPKIIKLWQDNSGEIIGSISLFDKLDLNQAQSAELSLLTAGDGEVSLLAKIRLNNGQEAWRVFKDRGFINNKQASLVTIPIPYNARNSEIFIKQIYDSSLGVNSQSRDDVKAEFSLDGANWQTVLWGKNIDFIQAATRSYFLKILFSPVANKFYSPYVDNLVFSYNCNIKD